MIFLIWCRHFFVTQKARYRSKQARYQLGPIFLISATHFVFFPLGLVLGINAQQGLKLRRWDQRSGNEINYSGQSITQSFPGRRRRRPDIEAATRRQQRRPAGIHSAPWLAHGCLLQVWREEGGGLCFLYLADMWPKLKCVAGPAKSRIWLSGEK